jgi:phage major head subunit gpT-like protein
MAIVAAPYQLQKGIRSTFIEALMASPDSLVQRLATYIKSDSDQEDHAWLGEVGGIEEFIDEVTFKGLSDGKYNLPNKKYTGGLQVKRDDLADEKTGGLQQRIRDLAVRAATYPNKLLIDAIVAGTTDLCYDGVSLFNNAHPIRGEQSATQDNLLGGTGTTTAQVSADINTAISTLYSFKDEAGEPINENAQKFSIVYPSALHQSVHEAVRAGQISGTSNVAYDTGAFDLIGSPRLTDANDWYMMISDPGMTRALIFQDREPVSFEALESGDESFKREVYSYKVRMRCRVGFGKWQRAVKIVNG